MAENFMSLEGKTALVTGSGRNIGRAIVTELAGLGANAVVNSRSNTEEAEAVREEVEAHGVKAIVVIGDASERTTVEAMKSAAERAFGRVDICVSNAARRLSRDFFETSDEDWHKHLNQQLTASWYLAKAFVPTMKQAGWGRIVNISGPDAWIGQYGWTRIPHSAAKGALHTMTKSLAWGLGQYGITVNEVCPGNTNTTRDPETHPKFRDPQFIAERIARSPIRRETTPAELAWACAFLCSERSGGITGTVIHVDGGANMIG